MGAPRHRALHAGADISHPVFSHHARGPDTPSPLPPALVLSRDRGAQNCTPRPKLNYGVGGTSWPRGPRWRTRSGRSPTLLPAPRRSCKSPMRKDDGQDYDCSSTLTQGSADICICYFETGLVAPKTCPGGSTSQGVAPFPRTGVDTFFVHDLDPHH